MYSITCEGDTIDHVKAETDNPSAYNFLALDIQRAELLALRGAQETLRNIDAVQVDVNFEELYEDCAQIGGIDKFLGLFDFDRVATVCPFHPSWGDAFYLRRTFIPRGRS